MTKHGEQSADRLMIEAAKKMVGKTGCTGLRIRELAEQAGVNLGLFHYHFRTKKRFTKIVLQEYYEEFLGHLTAASQDGETAEVQLRNSLLAMGLFVKREHEVYLALLKDIFNSDPQVMEFLRENAPRHMRIFHDMVKRCQKEGSLSDEIPLAQVMAFLMTSLNFPTLIGFIVMKRGGKRAADSVKRDFSYVLSDEAIQQRIDIALKGLKP